MDQISFKKFESGLEKNRTKKQEQNQHSMKACNIGDHFYLTKIKILQTQIYFNQRPVHPIFKAF